MKSLFSKSIGAPIAMAALLVLSACGGGGSSSSGVGAGSGGSSGVSPDATMVVKGNITGVSGAQARFDLQQGESKVSYIAWVAHALVPPAMAQTLLDGVEVCVEGTLKCDTTDLNGEFTLDLTGLGPGPYTLVFDYDGNVYSGVVNVKENTLTSLTATLQENEGQVQFTNIQVTVLSPSEGEGEGEGTVKVSVCHKPGTPAEQNLVISESALGGHLGHGDYEGACDVSTTNDGPVVEEPEETE